MTGRARDRTTWTFEQRQVTERSIRYAKEMKLKREEMEQRALAWKMRRSKPPAIHVESRAMEGGGNSVKLCEALKTLTVVRWKEV